MNYVTELDFSEMITLQPVRGSGRITDVTS